MFRLLFSDPIDLATWSQIVLLFPQPQRAEDMRLLIMTLGITCESGRVCHKQDC